MRPPGSKYIRDRWADERYRPGFESGPGREIMSSELRHVISWAVSEGSTVSSLICDRPAPLKLQPYGAIWIRSLFENQQIGVTVNVMTAVQWTRQFISSLNSAKLSPLGATALHDDSPAEFIVTPPPFLTTLTHSVSLCLSLSLSVSLSLGASPLQTTYPAVLTPLDSISFQCWNRVFGSTILIGSSRVSVTDPVSDPVYSDTVELSVLVARAPKRMLI